MLVPCCFTFFMPWFPFVFWGHLAWPWLSHCDHGGKPGHQGQRAHHLQRVGFFCEAQNMWEEQLAEFC